MFDYMCEMHEELTDYMIYSYSNGYRDLYFDMHNTLFSIYLEYLCENENTCKEQCEIPHFLTTYCIIIDKPSV